MKHLQILLLFLLFLSATACSIYEKPNYLKTFGTDHYWEGKSSTHTYHYYIDSIGEFRLKSTLIVDQTDSIHLDSFEKGSVYPSWITNKNHPNTHMIFFRYTFPGSDSLFLEVWHIADTEKVATDTFEEKEEEVLLLRKKKVLLE